MIRAYDLPFMLEEIFSRTSQTEHTLWQGLRKEDVAHPGWGGGCPLAVSAVPGRVVSGLFQMPGHRPRESQSRLYLRGQLGPGWPPVQLWQQGPMENREQITAPVQTRPGSLEARQPALLAGDGDPGGLLEATPGSHFYFQNEKGGTRPTQSCGGRGNSISLLHQAATCSGGSKPATMPWEGQASLSHCTQHLDHENPKVIHHSHI